VNKERLRELREFERGREIDMSIYGPLDRPGWCDMVEMLHNCGTAGCHAGYACAISADARWELKRIDEARVRLDTNPIFTQARRFLELSQEMAVWLFTSYSHVGIPGLQHCDDREARLRLDILIDASTDCPHSPATLTEELCRRMARVEHVEHVEELELVGV
jgi:hypothetical protein